MLHETASVWTLPVRGSPAAQSCIWLVLCVLPIFVVMKFVMALNETDNLLACPAAGWSACQHQHGAGSLQQDGGEGAGHGGRGGGS